MAGDGWTGPGNKSSPVDEDANRTYQAIKAHVKWQEQQRREAENLERAQQGLPPLKEKREGFGARAKRGLMKML